MDLVIGALTTADPPEAFLLEGGMAKVTVYRVKKYDISNYEFQISPRMATRKGAQVIGAEIIENTEREIDDSQLAERAVDPEHFGLPRL